MGGAAGMAVADAGAEHPGDVCRVSGIRQVEVVIEVIAGAVEEQADVQGLAARRHKAAPGRHAQGIVVIRLQLTLAPVILIDLRDVTRQTSLDRKRWRVPHRSVFHFGHDWGSGDCSGVLIG
ncbi:hypothetical protein D3C81_1391360 [compost metagenome]